MRWLLNTVYGVLLLTLSPLIVWRMLRHGRYRRGLKHKLFGRLPIMSGDRPVIWFHAVSVGEIVQLQKVVDAFRSMTGDQCQILVTSSTDTGFDLAMQRFEGCHVAWFPLDFSWSVRSAIRRVNPAMLVLMELEIWPNLLHECQRKGVSTAVINARLSENSFRGYRRIRRLIAPTFRRISVVAAQTDEYRDRMIHLGVNPADVVCTGSIKFDGVQTSRDNCATQALRSLLAINSSSPVFIAGSTQEPEEQLAVDAWKQLRHEFPSLRLILVPRHRERFDAVADLIVRSGCQLARRSEMNPQSTVHSRADEARPDEHPVILLDTIGELSACWGLADIAFVGGSFGSRGGQNMLEPAAYGAAVLFGPNTRNFRDVVSRLLAAAAAIQLSSPGDLLPTLRALLQDESLRRETGLRAAEVVSSQQGAMEATIDVLLRMLQQSTPTVRADRTAA